MDASRSEQRAVVQFQVAEGEHNAEIYRRMVTVYGYYCLGRTAVNKWCKSFRKRWQTTWDLPRPGQANKVITNDSIASFNEMIQANRRVTTREISHELNLSKGTVHIIIHQHLWYSKVCAAWALKRLSLDHQKRRMGFCLKHLIRYEEDLAFLDRTVGGDETWCHHYAPESKKTSMQWKHSSSPSPRKSKATITARKVMLSFFFDCRGQLLIEFLLQGSTINSAQYCSTMKKLRKAIKNKRPDLLTQGVILLHDSFLSHVSQETQRILNTFRWEVLEYSPDM